MSFWNVSTGEKATGEVQENNFDPLPEGYYLCMLEEVKVNDYQGRKSIQVKARVVGDGFGKNRVLFMGLKAFDDDSKKRDRAINLLVKCANVTGAKLPDKEPDDIWLARLCDKPLQIKVGVYDLKKDDGSPLKGNFIQNFEGKAHKAGEGKAVAAKKEVAATTNASDMDDDIPF